MRYHEISEQLTEVRHHRIDDIAAGFPRFALGLAKKVVIAPAPASHRRPARGGRAARSLLIICAAVFFFGPALAGLLGAQPGQIENRRLAGFPAFPRAGIFSPVSPPGPPTTCRCVTAPSD